MLNRNGAYITPNERSDRSIEMFTENNNPLSEYLEYRDIDYFLSTPGTNVYKDYKIWCSNNFIRNPIDKSDFITIVENHFDLIWKHSIRFNFNNKNIVRAGFKKR